MAICPSNAQMGFSITSVHVLIYLFFLSAFLIHPPSSRSLALAQHTEALLKSGDFTEASYSRWSLKGPRGYPNKGSAGRTTPAQDFNQRVSTRDGRPC